MSPDRIEYINGKKIEQYYWNGRRVVYIDNVRFDGTFDEAFKEHDMGEIGQILTDAGYEVAEGHEATKQAITDFANSDTQLLCSGWRVFPDGTKCPGCSDCKD